MIMSKQDRINELYTELREINKLMRTASSRNEYDDLKFKRHDLLNEIDELESN